MNATTVALLGAPAWARGLHGRLAGLPLHLTDTPSPQALNLLLEPDEGGAWRQRLQDAALPFQIVFGEAQALRAIGAALGRELVPTDEALLAGRGRWACDSCSDPDCEHRLFSALLARRAAGG